MSALKPKKKIYRPRCKHGRNNIVVKIVVQVIVSTANKNNVVEIVELAIVNMAKINIIAENVGQVIVNMGGINIIAKNVVPGYVCTIIGNVDVNYVAGGFAFMEEEKVLAEIARK